MRILQAPVRRRRFTFMLTPLVDIMFLMLIFFMVSSQTSPYSLLTMRAAGATSAAPAAAQADLRGPAVRVVVYGGYVRYNGVRVELADLGASVDRSRTAGAQSAVVLTAPAATVQDVVSVVEAFDSAKFGSVQLVMREGVAP